MRHKISVLLGMVGLFAACGVKKPMVVQDEKGVEALESSISDSTASLQSNHIGGTITEETLPISYLEGEYLYACKEKDRIEIDSTRSLVIQSNGDWKMYTNRILQKSGRMRKYHADTLYTVYNSNEKQLYLADTFAISGHIHSLKEMSALWKQGIPLVEGEYYHLEEPYQKYVFALVTTNPDTIYAKLYFDPIGLAEEGLHPCGWKRTIKMN